MLTVLCTIFPIVQLFILLVVMGCHPTIDNDQGDTVQNLTATEKEFKNMVNVVLKIPDKHHESITNWLSITTLNANNYPPLERIANPVPNSATDYTESQDTEERLIPIVQLFILLVVMGCHPTIDNDQGGTKKSNQSINQSQIAT